MKRTKKAICAITLLLLIFLFSALGTTTYAAEESVSVMADDLRVSSRFYELIFGEETPQNATVSKQKKMLIAGGDVFGIKIVSDTVTVADNKEALAKDASFPLLNGDQIISVGGIAVKTAEDVRKCIKNAENPLEICVKRGEATYTFEIPLFGEKGNYYLGIALRDGAAGIGTVTFIDPDTGNFGGLGHAISDPDTGDTVPMTAGAVTGVILGGVKRGESGKPGELHGVLRNETVGTLTKNDECGVFGTANWQVKSDEAIEIGTKDELKEGDATILSTVKNGEKGAYSVKITDIRKDEKGSKCFTVTVTDKTLLSITGGIVRGMSGSPIIQDGKLVGAVTHVLISDPKIGYGIFIENMIDAMSEDADTFELAA